MIADYYDFERINLSDLFRTVSEPELLSLEGLADGNIL
jgi:hypothetical protein